MLDSKPVVAKRHKGPLTPTQLTLMSKVAKTGSVEFSRSKGQEYPPLTNVAFILAEAGMLHEGEISVDKKTGRATVKFEATSKGLAKYKAEVRSFGCHL